MHGFSWSLAACGLGRRSLLYDCSSKQFIISNFDCSLVGYSLVGKSIHTGIKVYNINNLIFTQIYAFITYAFFSVEVSKMICHVYIL